MAPRERTSLRILAHPLRSRLLAQLRVHGASTATQLAAALATNTGATSYHLRQLAEAGLIKDTGKGTGRRREWAAATSSSAAAEGSGADTFDDEDDAAAAMWLQRDYVQYFAERADHWVQTGDQWPDPWREPCGLRDDSVLVSAEQLAALNAELTEVVQRYRRIGAGTPGARRIAAYTCLMPIDPLRPRSAEG